MTDALRRTTALPGRALPGRVVPGRTIPGRAIPELPVDVVRPAMRAVATRATTEVRRPYHIGTLLGVSACAYAVSLAGVTWLQASTEAATAAARQPAMTAVAQMSAENDRLATSTDAIRARLGAAGDDYGAAVAALTELETQLDALTARVAEVTAMSQQLPTRIAVPTRTRSSLPSVSRPAAASKPKVVATTGASGKP